MSLKNRIEIIMKYCMWNTEICGCSVKAKQPRGKLSKSERVCHISKCLQLLVDRTFVTPPSPRYFFFVFRWSYIFPTKYQISASSYFNIPNKSRFGAHITLKGWQLHLENAKTSLKKTNVKKNQKIILNRIKWLH